MTIEVTLVDYSDVQQGRDLIALLNRYALDDMGKGSALSDRVQQSLIKELAKRPHAFSIMVYVDGNAAGIANCFELFSTFAGQPLVNIHDIYVDDAYRGNGLSHRLLEKVEEVARQKGCCKITLEVLQGNKPAKQSYQKFGFKGYELDPELGSAMFWEKAL
jgi:GNAT superfamily N-acetyltransferase